MSHIPAALSRKKTDTPYASHVPIKNQARAYYIADPAVSCCTPLIHCTYILMNQPVTGRWTGRVRKSPAEREAMGEAVWFIMIR